MPFESTGANDDEFCSVLAQVMHIAVHFPDSHLIQEITLMKTLLDVVFIY